MEQQVAEQLIIGLAHRLKVLYPESRIYDFQFLG
jgi:hypothetical protein